MQEEGGRDEGGRDDVKQLLALHQNELAGLPSNLIRTIAQGLSEEDATSMLQAKVKNLVDPKTEMASVACEDDVGLFCDLVRIASSVEEAVNLVGELKKVLSSLDSALIPMKDLEVVVSKCFNWGTQLLQLGAGTSFQAAEKLIGASLTIVKFSPELQDQRELITQVV